MLRVEGLTVGLGDFLMRDVNFSVQKGEFFAIVGPTGVGKTVLLETILGFFLPLKGKIFIGSRDITCVPPERRGIAMIYQDYALFPHLTVRENILYGVRYRRSLSDVEKKFEELAEFLKLSNLLERFPNTLSGGEKQRVAIARALIVEPDVLLLDEPLSSLDPSFRDFMRKEIKDVQKKTGKTMLMVTHDFVDVFSLADRVAVMNKGVVEQVGGVEEVFRHPKNRFVADFVGMKNVFRAERRGEDVYVDGCRFELGRQVGEDSFYIALRPEDILLSNERIVSSARNSFKGVIVGIRPLNPYFEVDVDVKGVLFSVVVTASSVVELGLKTGKEIWLTFKASSLHII